MVITPDAELEAALKVAAEKQGRDPVDLALDVLRHRFRPRPLPFEPRDEWERGLLEAAIDCGVPNPETTYSREELYD